MLTDLFWTLATSNLVLGLVGLILIAALVVGYFPLLKWFPVLGEYVPVAKLASLLSVGLICFLVGVRFADDREATKQIQAKNALLTQRLQAANDVATMDAKRAQDDADKIAQLEKLANATPTNNSPCFDSDAAGRVRSIR
ncbi:MAG: hypothetical protein EKK40_06990 [Bradyrhizobiaceae bacterium]|nr:MAG: hypothetical protein EKK40_06990 [Bradyrhizobiaceae bacterium]